tara:strand:- start:4594 stop:4866 length:273 start_codon:yes stop_codon:yes gene_type:complete
VDEKGVIMSTTDKTKQEYVVEFIKSFDANEEAMSPFKEHRKDLRKNYVDNGWLSKEEVRFAVKAYRMLKSDDDYDIFNEIYKKLSKSLGR